MTPEYRDLACWAFGPSGIASLQLLAFGDFSCRGRFSPRNLILRRKDGPVADGKLPYRLESGDSLCDATREFLEACPSESLIYEGWERKYRYPYDSDEYDEEDPDPEDDEEDVDTDESAYST